MVSLENSEDGFAFSTGMAAVFAGFAALLSAGDHILANRSIFGSSYQILNNILPRWGIKCTFVDTNTQDTWEECINEKTKMLFVESPSTKTE